MKKNYVSPKFDVEKFQISQNVFTTSVGIDDKQNDYIGDDFGF